MTSSLDDLTCETILSVLADQLALVRAGEQVLNWRETNFLDFSRWRVAATAGCSALFALGNVLQPSDSSLCPYIEVFNTRSSMKFMNSKLGGSDRKHSNDFLSLRHPHLA